MDSSGYSQRSFNEREKLPNYTHGLAIILLVLEYIHIALPVLVLVPATALTMYLEGSFVQFLALAALIPVGVIVAFAATMFVLSRIEDPEGYPGDKRWEDYIIVKDEALKAEYTGKRIPMETMLEAYMDEKIEFKGDPLKTLWIRHEIFRFCFTPGHFKFFTSKFVGQIIHHSQKADTAEVRDVYDRGNDFYGWFLGPRMIYTSAIFESQDESLEVGQDRKMDIVCRQSKMKPGDKHLDIGCGWGTLLCHAAKYYGTISEGVTLAREQREYLYQVNAKQYGVEGKVDCLCMDYRDIPKKQYNVITSLEMAEHVGVKNFNAYLLQVRDMLADDGIFYMQIAGLRRAWQFEDLIWGLFMGTYIFPAADNSCPLGFVISSCERAGYEVHRVETCGVHYSLTLNHWYNNWMKNKKEVVAKYGEWWFRLWVIFLAWSTIIASQGSSTVFFITLHKNTSRFERRNKFVGKYPIATQM